MRCVCDSSEMLKAGDMSADHDVKRENGLIVDVDLILFGHESIVVTGR